MTHQDMTEIRKIIKEEIEAKFPIKTSVKSSIEVKGRYEFNNDVRRNVNIETISPPY